MDNYDSFHFSVCFTLRCTIKLLSYCSIHCYKMWCHVNRLWFCKENIWVGPGTETPPRGWSMGPETETPIRRNMGSGIQIGSDIIQRSSPSLWTEWQTCVKTWPFPAVIILPLSIWYVSIKHNQLIFISTYDSSLLCLWLWRQLWRKCPVGPPRSTTGCRHLTSWRNIQN